MQGARIHQGHFSAGGFHADSHQLNADSHQLSAELSGEDCVVEASQGGLVTELPKHDVSSHVPFMQDPSQLLGYASGWLPSSTSFSSIPVPDRLLSKILFGA